MTTVLYCRVSTLDQTLEHQRTQAHQNGFKPDLVLADPGVSGVSIRLRERPEGRRLFDILRAGDTLVVRWVDRLGRNYQDVTDTVREFIRRGIRIETVINRMTFDGTTADPMRQAIRDSLIAFMAATAQAQAEISKEAQKAGIAHAQANDDGTKYRGRKPTFTCEQFVRVRELLNQGLGISAIAKMVGLKRQSVYRIRLEPEKQVVLFRHGIPKSSRNSCLIKCMLLDSIANVLKSFVRTRRGGFRQVGAEAPIPALKSIGFNDFLKLDIPPREMLLHPILPERSLAMLYAPRGIGKTLLSLSIGLAVSSGSPLLRWFAPKQKRVLYVDGEMPLVSLQERLRVISVGLGAEVSNGGFRILAADQTEKGISLGTEDGQQAIEPLLTDVDLLILDNLSTLCTTGSESASDAWVPMQNWLLGLRRKGVTVLLVHHAGINGRQRGTSRREDALDTVIALRRPEDYSSEQGARFEVHCEKLRNRIDCDAVIPFEARLVSTEVDDGVSWSDNPLKPPLWKQAGRLFQEGLSVRQVATVLQISKTEAGRLRLRALDDGLLLNELDDSAMNGHRSDLIIQKAVGTANQRANI